MSGPEVLVECAVFEHVIGRREDRGGNGADRFLRPASSVQPHELRVEVGGLSGAAAQAHWTSLAFSQGAPVRRRVERRLPWAFSPRMQNRTRHLSSDSAAFTNPE